MEIVIPTGKDVEKGVNASMENAISTSEYVKKRVILKKVGKASAFPPKNLFLAWKWRDDIFIFEI